MRYKILVLIFISNMSGIFSQIPGLDLLNGKKSERIKFQYVQGFILIDVKYGNIFPLKMIFDTGAQNTILFDELTASLTPLNYDREIQIAGANLNLQITARIGRGAKFKIQELPSVKRDIIVLMENFMNVEEIIGQEVHGILGSDFFKGLIVEINFKKGYLNIYDPKHFNYGKLKEYEKLDVYYSEGKPYINTIVNIHGNDTINTRLLIDTGAALGLLLHNDTHPSLTLPEKTIKGSLGKGLSGDIVGYLGRINSFKLGKYKFERLVTYYQEYDKFLFGDSSMIKRNGIIGTYLLDRFSLVFDQTRSNLYIKAYKNYNKKFKYDKSGIVVFATGKNLNEFVINDVIEGSPAYIAGVKPGDKILKIGWFFTSSSLTLEKINSIFAGKPGKKIKLKVLRNGEKIKLEFILKELL